MLRWESVTTPTGPRPKARGGHASASCSDGGALFFGGADRSAAVFDELLRVDVGPCDQGASSCAWRKIDVAKRGHVGFPARTGCTMTRVGDALYVFGGQDPKSGAAFNDVLVVDTTTKEWTLSRCEVVGGSPQPRHSHTAVAVGEGDDAAIVVFGGAGQQGAPLRDTWIFSPAQRAWTYPTVTGAVPRAREMHAAAATKGRMAVYGGRDAEGRVLSDVALLDLDTLVWQRPQTTPYARCAHTCCAVAFASPAIAEVAEVVEVPEDGASPANDPPQEGILVFGGFSGERVESSLLFIRLDANQDAPTELIAHATDVTDQAIGQAPRARFAHAAACVTDDHGWCNAIVIFGGVEPRDDLDDVAILRCS